MKCRLEKSELNKYYFFGTYQFVKDGPFFYAAIGVRDDSIVLYNDTKPDREVNDELTYFIKRIVPFTDISTLYISKIVKAQDIPFQYQITFILKNVDDSVSIYVEKKDIGYVKATIKHFKKHKVKVKKEKVNLSPIY